MPTRRLCLLALALAVGACDMPADPLPTNRYDPLYDGERIGTTPTNVRVTSATTTSITFTWDDVSSFETGYRIEERISPESQNVARWETVGRVGADETAFTWEGLTDLTRKEVRLVLEVEGESASEPTESVWVAYPTTQVGSPGGVLSRDGRRLLAEAPSRQTRVFDAATGGLLATLPFDEFSEGLGARLVGWRSFQEENLVLVDGVDIIGQRSFDCFCNDGQVLAQSGTLVVNWVPPLLERMDLETGAFDRMDTRGRLDAPYRPVSVSADERYVLFRLAANSFEPDRLLVYDLEQNRVAWRPSDRGANYRGMLMLPGGEAILASRQVDPQDANSATPVLLDVATGAEIRSSGLRMLDLVSVAPDGSSFAYTWAWTGNPIPKYRVGIASVESLAPIREAVLEGRAGVRVLSGGEGWRFVAGDVLTTGRFDAVWEQIPAPD